MATKSKSDVKVLKGQDAEDAILRYMNKMNRPFGAADISANLKGAVPKATTAKILASLAEKGAIVQKSYGKINLYVADQNDIETPGADDLAALETECKTVEEANDGGSTQAKHLQSELSRFRSTPTDVDLEAQIKDTELTIARLSERLAPLRSGVPLISSDDLAKLELEWDKWRPEWMHRRKVFTSFWELATEALPPQEATALAEDLGIEHDTPEHLSLERSPLCTPSGQSSKLKRKRE